MIRANASRSARTACQVRVDASGSNAHMTAARAR
jgi:hypothetical protein